MTSTRAWRSPLLLVTTLLGAQGLAHAWATHEHVRFGNVIAEPFEKNLLGKPVPVLPPAEDGPTAFGHWVSAPDFGRSLTHFYKHIPAPEIVDTGVVKQACSVHWNPEGASVDGMPVDNQSFELTEAQKLQMKDCVNGWTVNNSHFGDFARAHFMYYHRQALKAARLYRASGQTTCQNLAYTLEGWGQHYLTDSTAAGHGWNPSGGYGRETTQTSSLTGIMDFTPFALQILEGPAVRMRIHNALNDKTGARMAGSLYDKGTFWGDNSQKHSDDGLSSPEHGLDDPQTAITLRLGRMALGQVMSAAECGGASDPTEVFKTRDELGDPRKLYVSNASMCKVMFGPHVWDQVEDVPYVPDWLDDQHNLLFLNIPTVRAAISDCRANAGELMANGSGNDLAAHYFMDEHTRGDAAATQLPYSDDEKELLSLIDEESLVDFADYGCDEHVLNASNRPAQKDLCGNAVCELPVPVSGECPSGMVRAAGCCYKTPALSDGGGSAQAMDGWFTANLGMPVDLRTSGATPGEDSDFLWVKDDASSMTMPKATAFVPLTSGKPVSATLPSDSHTADCAGRAFANVYQTRVRIPRSTGLANTAAVLSVSGMDEGVKVQVNGQLVAYLNQKSVAKNGVARVQLTSNAMPSPTNDDTYLVQLTSLNTCGADARLGVAISLENRTGNGKADGDGFGGIDDSTGPEGAGCSMAPSGRGTFSSGLFFALLMVVGAAGRRRLRVRR